VNAAGSADLRQDDAEAGRREHVLDTALLVFARYGYRKASMEDVARAAGISRPGLYFYFASKKDLFRAAVTRSLDSGVTGAERALADTGRPLRDRLIEAIDQWTGRYVGPLANEIDALIADNPDLLGEVPAAYPLRFASLVTDALAAQVPAGRPNVADDVAQTILSLVAGLKHQAGTREEFLARVTIGVGLLLPVLERD
jgi:AcrR family transcriptional regulator